MTVVGRIGIEGLITVNSAVEGTPTDSAQHMARCGAVAARPTTVRWCDDKHKSSGKARGYQKVEG